MSEKEFEMMYNKFYGRLFIYARKFLENVSDCQDVIAEVFIAVWKEDIRLTAEEGWILFTMTRNKCLDVIKLRKHFVSTEYLKDDHEEEHEIIYVEYLGLTYECMKKLPKRRLEVLRHFLADLSTKEISEKLGISIQNVLNSKNCAINNLKRIIDKKSLKWHKEV